VGESYAVKKHDICERSKKKSFTCLSQANTKETIIMKQSGFPPGWDEERVRRVLDHYETQTEAEAVAEDEGAWEGPSQTVMEIPRSLVPLVRELIAKHQEV